MSNTKILFISDRSPELNPFLPLIFQELKNSNYSVDKVLIKRFYKIYKTLCVVARGNYQIVLFTRTSVLPFVLFISAFSSLLHKRIKLIYWPFELYGHQNSKYSFLVKKLERFYINKFDLLVTQNNFRALYFKLLGRTNAQIVVRNYKPINSSKVIQNSTNSHSKLRRLVYVGSLIKGRNLDTLITTILHIEDTQLVIYAKKKASGRFLAVHHNLIRRAMDLNKLIIHDEVPENLIPEILLGFEVGIMPYENNCLNNFTAEPAKLTEYLGAGLICIVPDFPVFDELILGNRFQIIKYQNIENDLVKSINFAFDQVNDTKRNISRHNALDLDYSLQVQKFIDFLSKV